jgi:hypothetical protein
VHGVGDVNMSLLILTKSVGIAPNDLSGRNQPVVDTFVSVSAAADDRMPGSGLTGYRGIFEGLRVSWRCRLSGASHDKVVGSGLRSSKCDRTNIFYVLLDG